MRRGSEAGRIARTTLAVTLAALPAFAEPQGEGIDHAAQPGTLEGRPGPDEVSRVQLLIDASEPGAKLEIGPGSWEGDLILHRPITLVGRGRPRLVGSKAGSVVRVRAAGVVIEGFDLDGRGGGNLGRDTSGIHVAAQNVTVRDCRIEGSLFGIYLREAHGAVVEDCTVVGIPGRDPGEKGSGIHIWNTRGFRVSGNTLRDVRDGLYIQSASGGRIFGNTVADMRYGIHYMFSDENTFEDNRFENGAAGAALMYSRKIVFRRNQFLRNRGFASVGLLFKACDDVVAEENLIADNARGIFLEGSYRNTLLRNVVAGSDAAIVLYDSCGENRFEGNAFFGNLTPLQLVGRRTDTVFRGNYWSGNDEPDLDGDGASDLPYRLSSVFDHLRGNLNAADLVSDGPAAAALGAAERALPILDPTPVFDSRPLARPPDLSAVPRPSHAGRGLDPRGLGVAAAALALGVAGLAPRRGRRRS